MVNGLNPYLLIAISLILLGLGGVIGWLISGRNGGAIKAERDLFEQNFRAASNDLSSVISERNEVKLALATLQSEQESTLKAHELRIAELRDAKDALTAQFSEIGGKILGDAQQQFLERAEQRFKQSEEMSGQELKALLAPVHDRLQKYEESVGKIEAERRESFGNLHGLMEAMRVGQEQVKSEAARLGNSLRNAPKARGRWGEQQLRNVLESCGLSEHADFQAEVSVNSEFGRLRPDVLVRIPGGNMLVIDAKVSLNAYQDAFEADDEQGKRGALDAHAAAMKAHINALGAKAYWDQFEAAPDYVIMFVPGEHFLSAALEHDTGLWDYAFEKRVLLATPTNLIAIARTVAAVWRQEKLADDAREIAALGKELYSRLATMGGHVGRVGRNLETAVTAYNALVGSLESQVLTQAKRFEELHVDTGAKQIEALPVIEQSTRPMVKLVQSPEEAA